MMIREHDIQDMIFIYHLLRIIESRIMEMVLVLF